MKMKTVRVQPQANPTKILCLHDHLHAVFFVGRLIGLLPLSHVHPPGRSCSYQLVWSSPTAIFTVILLSIQAAFMATASYFGFLWLSQVPNVVDRYTTYICTVILLIDWFISLSCGIVLAPAFATLLNNLIFLDQDECPSMDKMYAYHQYRKRFSTITMVVVGVLVFGSSTLSLYTVSRLSTKDTFDSYMLPAVQCVWLATSTVHLSAYLHIGNIIAFRFNLLAEETYETLQRQDSDLAALEMDRIRCSYGRLRALLAQVDTCFSEFIVTATAIVIVITVMLYRLLSYSVITTDPELVFLVVFSNTVYVLVLGARLCIFTLAGQQVTTAALAPLDHLQSASLIKTSPAMQFQVQAFTTRLCGSPLSLTAAGFFAVNKGTLCSMVTAVTTYLIVIFQFGATPPTDTGYQNATTG